MAKLIGAASPERGRRRADEPLANQGVKMPGQRWTDLVGEDKDRLVMVELFADDRRPLEHDALARAKSLEPGRKQRVNAWRERHLPLAWNGFVQQSHDLFKEQGVALGGGDNPSFRVAGSGRAEQLANQEGCFTVLERLELDGSGVPLTAAPGGAVLEQLRAGKAEEQDRSAAGE